MIMESSLKAFIEDLSKTRLGGSAFNQYSHQISENAVRRNNLLIYLKQMTELSPRFMLVGEAPSYRGGRLTGVPFTSRHILLNGIDELGLFGDFRGYSVTSESAEIRKEQSATILWGTLARLNTPALIWNAFPFHPHKHDNALSNRIPTISELRLGERFLRQILDLFSIKEIVAVGNKAETSIKSLGLAYTKVRHPAQGGKNQFVKGIEDCFQRHTALS